MMTDDAVPTADPRFDAVDDVRERLRSVDYLSDEGIAGIVYLADRLGKPLLTARPGCRDDGRRPRRRAARGRPPPLP